MARTIKPRKAKAAIAVVVDGPDEKWYIDQARKHYCNGKARSLQVSPKFPSRKKVKDLFEAAEDESKKEYTQVVLIIDMDDILCDQGEYQSFCSLYEKYQIIKSGGRVRGAAWMKKLVVIVNNPCLEYWYLLHHSATRRFFDRYKPELYHTLRKCPKLSDYEKSETYYNNIPDIYTRLGHDAGVAIARSNAYSFDIASCSQEGCSEMNILFDLFDAL